MTNCTLCGRYLAAWRSRWSACLPDVKLVDSHVYTCMPCRVLYVIDPSSVEVTQAGTNEREGTDMTA